MPLDDHQFSERTILEQARIYQGSGYFITPLRGKDAFNRDWQLRQQHWTEAELQKFFNEDGCNIGLVTGKKSGGLVDIDYDCPEAVEFDKILGLNSGFWFGRASTPISHKIFLCTGDIPDCIDFDDPLPTPGQKSKLLEIRGNNRQTMAPPSIHPCGEKLVLGGPTPTTVDVAELIKDKRKVALACLIARHYPSSGNRDSAWLGISGLLARAGWSEEEINFFTRVVVNHCEDESSKERRGREKGKKAVQRMESERLIAGRRQLLKAFKPEVVTAMYKFLGFAQSEGIVWLPSELPRVCDEVIDELLAHEGHPYNLAGSLVVIEKGMPTTVHQMDKTKHTPIDLPHYLKAASLKDRIMQVMKIGTFEDGKWKPIGCPRDVPEVILAGRMRQFPTLQGICNSPFLGFDDQIVQGHGYHERTGLWMNCDQIQVSPTCVNDARRLLLEETYSEFPFVSDLDHAVIIALLLTVLQRALLPTAPMFGANAPSMSSGKTTLMTFTALLGTGNDNCLSNWSTNEEELTKGLVGIFLEKVPYVVFDDVKTMRSSTFASILTHPSWKQRALGVNERPTFSTAVTWGFTGKNPTIAADISMRTIKCTLDPNCCEPEKRVFKRDLVSWAAENRSRVISAALSVMKLYRESGQKVDGGATRFHQWARMIRDPLMWIGLPDVAKAFDESRSEDPDRTKEYNLIENLVRVFGHNKNFRSKDVMTKFKDDHQLVEALKAFTRSDKDVINGSFIGNLLNTKNRVNAPDGKLVKVSESNQRTADWSIFPPTDAPQPVPVEPEDEYSDYQMADLSENSPDFSEEIPF